MPPGGSVQQFSLDLLVDIPACVLQPLAYHIDHGSAPGRLNAVKLTFAKLLGECPECGCDNAQITAREGFVERFFFRILLMWPYRCSECGTRFWDHTSSERFPTKNASFRR